MKNRKFMLAFIFLLVMASVYVMFKYPTKLGLDLVGGSKLVLEAQTSAEVPKITNEIMDALKVSVEKRVNAIGVAETVVQKVGEKRLIVEIPNIKDPQKAKEFLGKTANLEFKKAQGTKDGEIDWVNTGITGKDLKRAYVATDQSGGWVVSLEFNSQGQKKFAKVTTGLVGKPLAIFFDEKLVSAPTVQSPIENGNAQISGDFTYDAAKEMVDLLNAGALPVPAKIIQENSVGPTLGADSLKKSLMAGAVGIGVVILFMIAYYRVPGVIASIALIIYSLLVFAVFKLIPVTLTLAGIAGFILSIGMAVDANILIFERTKEELKSGRTLFTAINTGFDRAFTSIFDSNMTTIITCVILYMLGTSIVRGFALTLAIGVGISMFTAITVTKTFMHVVFGSGQLKHPGWFGLKPEHISKAASFQDTSPRKAKFGVID